MKRSIFIFVFFVLFVVSLRAEEPVAEILTVRGSTIYPTNVAAEVSAEPAAAEVPAAAPVEAPPAPPAEAGAVPAEPAVAAPAEPAAEVVAAPGAMDGDAFAVSEFIFLYELSHPDLPDVESLQDLEVVLGVTLEGFVAPRAGVDVVTLRLGDLRGGSAQTFYASAIVAVDGRAGTATARASSRASMGRKRIWSPGGPTESELPS